MAWFDKHWKGYKDWVKEVKRGMAEFVVSFGSTIGPETHEQEERTVVRKLPEAILS